MFYFDPKLIKQAQEQLKSYKQLPANIELIKKHAEYLQSVKHIDFKAISDSYKLQKDFIETFISKENLKAFSEEYDKISSNPTPQGKENFIMYKSLCIFICIILTLLDFSPTPFIKSFN